MKARPAVVILALALTLLPSALRPQELVLEAEPGVQVLSACDTTHVLLTCIYKHVENELGVSAGGIIQLDGEQFIVVWMGPGYHLESGIVIEPQGDAVKGLRGQRWLEVYPDQGKIHTSLAWKDADGNRSLSASDSLTLDSGPALMVKDVRLQLRVTPASARAEPPSPAEAARPPTIP